MPTSKTESSSVLVSVAPNAGVGDGGSGVGVGGGSGVGVGDGDAERISCDDRGITAGVLRGGEGREKSEQKIGPTIREKDLHLGWALGSFA